jgi:long-chain acyl-CoA synthetase
MELLARFLANTERTIYALIRGGDDDEASERLRVAARTVLPGADRFGSRLVPVRGDVTLPDLGLDEQLRERLAEDVTQVVHSAASVSFNLPLDKARAINTEGTRRLLEFAKLCALRGDGLERYAHVSTAYVAGTHRGAFYEHDLNRGQRFNNSYELSKWEAEQHVRSCARRIPVTIVRPSIVVGEEDSGWTPAFNVVYGPLAAYSRGSLPVLPARRSAPVDVVPVSYVADAIFNLASREDTVGQTYTLAAGPEASNVGELIDMSAAAFGRRRALALRPSVYRRVVHPWLVGRGSPTRRRAVKRTEAYFPYFDMRARFDTGAAIAALEPAGIHAPPLSRYFDALVRFAEEAEWGRRPLSRVDARATVDSRPASERPLPRLQPVSA